MRLIDADALKERINTTFWSEIGAIIDNAPTIEPCDIIACEKADELDMLERMYLDNLINEEPCKSAEQNVANVPSGETISRAEVIEVLQSYLDILINSRRHGDDVTLINVLTDIRNKLSALPSADRPKVNSNSAEEQIAETCERPQVNSAEWVAEKEKEFEELNRPKGEWIMHIDDLFPEESTQECSNCHEHETVQIRNDNFCPNCGADMRGVDR